MARLSNLAHILGVSLHLLRGTVMAADPSLDPHWATPSSYKRIRITERGDIEATYPLIAAYVQDPALALSINEMVVDPDSWPSGRNGGCSFYGKPPNSELDEPPKPVSEDAHAAVEVYVSALGLGNATTNAMIDALRWKKDHLLGRRPAVPRGFRDSNRDYAGTATALLLSLARNLETLHMGAMDHGGHGAAVLEDYLLHTNYGRLPDPALQNLKTLHYVALDGGSSGYRDERHYDELDFLTQLRCFHRLPALETVAMDAVMEYQRVTRYFYPPGTASFKHLRITHADISGGMLAAMARMPRALEEFTLSMGGLWHTDGGSPHLRYKTLGKALREHKSTLRVLDLDLGDVGRGNQPEEEDGPEDDDDDDDDEDDEYLDEWYRIDEADSPGPQRTHQLPDGNDGRFGLGIGSLKGFTALQRLSIDPHTLLGWNRQEYVHDPDLGSYYRDIFDPPFRLIDALPQGLEVLRLYDYLRGRDATVDGHIRELMRLKAERLPNLREVEGVEETIETMGVRSSDRDEDELWERLEKEVHWVRDEL